MEIHFIGIGGIGVSALAKYYLEKGNKISGSDLVSSEITEALEKKGAKISIGKHKPENITKDIDLVVHSPAVQPDNLELKKAKEFKIKTKSYPQALGDLTKKYFTIAVSGTHGKSTTTAMIGLLLTRAGFDPTVIVGTKIKEFEDSNCRVGKSKYLVIEACEHEASFLNYWPKIIVITNIEKEHLDYYKNLNNVLRAFKKFVSHLPSDGILIANKDDRNISKLKIPTFAKASAFGSTKSAYGPTKSAGRQNSKLHLKAKSYSLRQKDIEKLKKNLKVPGKHNVYNALAALNVARVLKISDKISFESLANYRGSWRRFETHHGTWNKKHITVVNDYAHHPTEIKATLTAAREKFSKKKIWAVFQPHQYQRTFYLFKDFIEVLSKAPIDKLIIIDVYDVAGRENTVIKKKVSSRKLVEKLKAKTKKEIIYIPSIKKTAKYLNDNLKGGEVIIIMGAGDIYKLADYFHYGVDKERF